MSEDNFNTVSYWFVTGSNISTVCRNVEPSYPPHTYNLPFKVATPRRHLLVSIGTHSTHFPVWGSYRSTCNTD